MSEEVCEKKCIKRKMLAVAEDCSDFEDTPLGSPVALEKSTIDSYRKENVELSKDNVEETKDKKIELDCKLPNVKEVIETYERKHSLEATPFSPRKRIVPTTRATNIEDLENQIMNSTDLFLDSLIISDAPVHEVRLSPIERSGKLEDDLKNLEEVCEKKCSSS